ncbi:uncharacterized [Tachysurus ichikawai]
MTSVNTTRVYTLYTVHVPERNTPRSGAMSLFNDRTSSGLHRLSSPLLHSFTLGRAPAESLVPSRVESNVCTRGECLDLLRHSVTEVP